LACIAERAFLRVLEGGCSVPVAVTSEVLPAGIRLAGGVWSLDGSRHIGAVQLQDFPVITAGSNENENGHESTNGATASYAAIAASNLMTAELVAAEQCGKALAHQLIGEGAEAILKEARAQNDKK
jgi:porphobilinogen deaminase